MRIVLNVAGIVILTLAWACAPATPPTEEADVGRAAVDAATVNDLLQAWDNAINSGDSGQTVDLYAEGATMLPPESPALNGKEAIGGFLDQLHATGKLALQDKLLGYHASADTIAAHGTWTLDTAPTEGDAMQDSGRWVAMWEREADSSWKVVRNIWNSERLPEGLAAPPGSGLAPASEVPQPATPVCPQDPAALDNAFASTFGDGDLAANIATHAENGVRHPPYMGSVSGRAAMTSFIGAYLERFDPRELTLNIQNTYQAEDWGASWGTYTFAATLRDGGGEFKDTGKYIAVSTKGGDGCWRSDWVLWNADSRPM